VRVLAFPDLHAPYQHPEAYSFVAAVADDFKPHQIVCLGDEIDSYGLSRFAKNPDLDNPGRELTAAREALAPFFSRFPNVRVCNSNHVYRGLKRAQEAGLPSAYVRPLANVLGAPRGWRWADEWELDGVVYCHGEGFSGPNGAAALAGAIRQSVVIGHLHAYAGVRWIGSRAGNIFAANAGCLINPTAPAFDYAKHSKHRPVLGCVTVADGVPQFVPMV
jgi:predicted phosphodiesterase